MSEWVKLGRLRPGQSFLTRDGRLAVVDVQGYSTAATRPVMYTDGTRAPALHTVEVLPLDPATLAADRAELTALRGWVEDVRGLEAPVIEQERALVLEAAAAVLCEYCKDGSPVEYDDSADQYSHPAVRTRGYATYCTASPIRALGPPPAPERLAEVRAERDRLRAALEEIVKPATGRAEMVKIASKALEG